jgi:hypothetical protein
MHSLKIKKIAGLLLLSSVPAFAQGPMFKTAEGGKVDSSGMIQLGTEQPLVPSQLHGISTPRIAAGAVYQIKNIDTGSDVKTLAQPTAMLTGSTGFENFVFGIGASHTESKADAGANNFREFDNTDKAMVQAAYTIAENFTVGVGSSGSWLNFKQNSTEVNERKFSSYFHKETGSLSFQVPSFEVGLAYTTGISLSMGKKSGEISSADAGFSLVNPVEETTRSIYDPAYYTAFARSDFAPAWSGIAAISHVQYDKNVREGSDVFDSYDRRDRLAGNLQAIYWLNNRKSNIALSGNHAGATFSPESLATEVYGYKLANLYGGSIGMVTAVAEKTYLGITAGYERGERDDTINSVRYRATERKTSVAGSLNVTM